MPILPFTVQLALGTAAQTKVVTPAIASTFANMIAAFEECCLVGLDLEIRLMPVSAFDQGFLAVAIDEADSTVPTASILTAPHLEIMLAQATSNKVYRLKWMPGSYTDLSWQPTSSLTPLTWLKFFANVANTFTDGASICKFLFTGTAVVDFRQFKQ
jgi:hypothetical protein